MGPFFIKPLGRKGLEKFCWTDGSELKNSNFNGSSNGRQFLHCNNHLNFRQQAHQKAAGQPKTGKQPLAAHRQFK
jgi:hypothetical protein